MPKKTAKQVYKTGKPQDFTSEHIAEIIQNLYAKELAKAFFFGMGWPEGYRYCEVHNFVMGRFNVDKISRDDLYRFWHACVFLD